MSDNSKNIMIGVAVAAGVLTIGYFMTKFVGKLIRGGYKKYTISDFTTKKSGGSIITVPKSDLKKYDVVIVYGGIAFATPDFMLKELKDSSAKNLLYSNIFIFVPYTNKWAATSVWINEIEGKYKVNNMSIIGYSAGGIDVQDAYSHDYKFVGLIDPSTESRFLKKPFGKNVYMVFNDANWSGRYAAIGRTLVKLEKVINDKGGNAKKIEKKHRDLPKYFFEKYENEINGFD